jgi:zona occludens toxin
MIFLTTGQPGAGKTLYTLYYVQKLAQKENRQVYYNGVADLKIPGWLELDNAEDWHKLPPGSIVLLDECQRLFRPRGNGAAVPEYVAKLETHRHQGLDLFFITQHPMLVDTNVRRLVGKHFHVKRTFGMERATVHEFPDLRQEPDKSREGSVRHEFKYPPEVFTWYKSAEVHTVKRSIPARLWFLLLLPIILGALIWATVAWWQGKMESKDESVGGVPTSESALPSPTKTPSSAKPLTTAEYLDQHKPRIDGLPHTAPLYDKVMQVKTAPQPKACVASRRKCTCYTDQVTVIDMSDALCRQIAENGFFDPTIEAHQAAAALQDKAPPSVTMPAGAI